jgi:hypothetical protein
MDTLYVYGGSLSQEPLARNVGYIRLRVLWGPLRGSVQLASHRTKTVDPHTTSAATRLSSSDRWEWSVLTFCRKYLHRYLGIPASGLRFVTGNGIGVGLVIVVATLVVL